MGLITESITTLASIVDVLWCLLEQNLINVTCCVNETSAFSQMYTYITVVVSSDHYIVWILFDLFSFLSISVVLSIHLPTFVHLKSLLLPVAPPPLSQCSSIYIWETSFGKNLKIWEMTFPETAPRNVSFTSLIVMMPPSFPLIPHLPVAVDILFLLPFMPCCSGQGDNT